jgi:hypothetical protein
VSDGGDVRARDVEFGDAEELLLLFGHDPAARFGDVGYQQHVGTVGIEVEVLVDTLAQH